MVLLGLAAITQKTFSNIEDFEDLKISTLKKAKEGQRKAKKADGRAAARGDEAREE